MSDGKFKQVVGLCPNCHTIRMLDNKCPVCGYPPKEAYINANKSEGNKSN